MVRPTTAGSLPYRFFQTPLPSITTAAAPGRSSSGRKSRPIVGNWPSNLNPLADMYTPLKRSGGLPSSLRFMVAPV
jgi:hypothetical protein